MIILFLLSTISYDIVKISFFIQFFLSNYCNNVTNNTLCSSLEILQRNWKCFYVFVQIFGESCTDGNIFLLVLAIMKY